MMAVSCDNGVQFFSSEDVERIGSMSNDTFINENKSLERRFSNQEVAEYFDISVSEVERINKEYGVPAWF